MVEIGDGARPRFDSDSDTVSMSRSEAEKVKSFSSKNAHFLILEN